MLELLGLHQGDELHVKIANGKIVQTTPVRITPDLEMSPDAVQRFEELESEPAFDLRDSLQRYETKPDKDVAAVEDRILDHGLLFQQAILKPNNMRVGPMNFHRSDDRIQEFVAEALANAPLDVSNVEVKVQKGEVTLTGKMKDRREAIIAKLVTRNVLGVADVHNDIQITSSTETLRIGQNPASERIKDLF